MSTFRRILVPVDYSASSDEALRMAADVARGSKGELLVLHLVPLDAFATLEVPMMGGVALTAADGLALAEETDRLRAHVRDVVGDRAPRFDVEVGWGSPYHRIVEIAVERDVDLIVIGTQGRTGVKHVLLGSVAEKTVRLAPCPVLTVRASAPKLAASASGAEASAARPPSQVGHLMHRPVATVGPDDMLEDARQRMARAGVRHVAVVDGTKLVGVLSDSDLAAHASHLARTRVHAVMTPDPVSIETDASPEAAARLMLERRVRSLPVLADGEVIGVLSTSDILEDYVRAARP